MGLFHVQEKCIRLNAWGVLWKVNALSSYDLDKIKSYTKGLTMIFEASVYLQLYVSLFKTAPKAFDCLRVIENDWNGKQ